MKVYVIGSLKNPQIPVVAAQIRSLGFDVFDDWYGAGPNADDHWMELEKSKGHDFATALEGHSAQLIFGFDKSHIDSSDIVVLVMPAGKSGHLEFGYAMGARKLGFILLDGEPERFDVMYNFADGVFTNVAGLLDKLQIHCGGEAVRDGDSVQSGVDLSQATFTRVGPAIAGWEGAQWRSPNGEVCVYRDGYWRLV